MDSKEQIDHWLNAASSAREIVKNAKDIVLVFHNDADGLASGTIAKVALERLGIKPTMYCLEKMYPEVVETIHKHHGSALFIYTDIGSGEVDLIERVNKGTVIILDHHKTKKAKTSNTINLDPELFGMNGGEDACGATLAYLFFKDLADIHEYIDLAIIGMQEIPGPPRGLNKTVAGEYGKPIEHQKLERFGKIARSVSRDLTVLGSVGYYTNGVIAGMELAENGYTKEIKEKIRELEEKRKSVVRSLVNNIRLNETMHVQWFDAGSAFEGMGTKTIGTFCSYLVHRAIAPDKILLGFMDVGDKIPRINGIELEISGNYTKVSARVPEAAKENIKSGEWPGVGELMSRSCREVGGFGDGHDFAASGVVPKDAKEKLVQAMERELTKSKGLNNWV